MHPFILLSAAATILHATAHDSPAHLHGHGNGTSNVTNILSFGRHYAVLNLDLIASIVDPIANSSSGQTFIDNTAHWISAVHAQHPPPLQLFTRVYFSGPYRAELQPGSAFAALASFVGNVTDPGTQIYPAFDVDEAAGDVVLQKTRTYAGAGNALEEILRARRITTVILTGLETARVVLATALRLYDLDYEVYVISDCTYPREDSSISQTVLESILPQLPVSVITLEQALAALDHSGPAVY